MSTFTALFRKELREGRTALLAGLIIFWLMPAIWALVYNFIEPGTMIGGALAWMLLIGGGWLFAVVVGAHTVCRDWGRPEEHFLLSRPVSASQAVLAKLWAGLSVVLFVIAVNVGWALVLLVYSKEYRAHPMSAATWGQLVIEAFLPLLLMMTVSFVLAFAAAVLTRQILPSVLLAVLVLIIWAAAPLLYTRLGFLLPTWIARSARDYQAETLDLIISRAFIDPFWIVVAGVLTASLTVALVCAGRESKIRMSQKQLAWGMCITVLALFWAATHEMGNSLTVRDQLVLDMPENQVRSICARGQQFITIGFLKEGRDSTRMVSFQVDDGGKIRDVRTGTFTYGQTGDANAPRRYTMPYYKIDEQGKLMVTLGPYSYARTDQCITRLVVGWPAGGDPQVISRSIARSPEVMTNESIQLVSWLCTERYACLVYDPKYPGPEAPMHRWPKQPYQLSILEWNNVGEARLVKEVPVPGGSMLQMVDRRLAVYHEIPLGGRGFRVKVATFDLDKPEEFYDPQQWVYKSRDFPAGANCQCWNVRQLRRVLASGQEVDIFGEDAALTVDGMFKYVSTPFSLDVLMNYPNRWEEVASIRMSPLAYLFRGYVEPDLVDDSLLVERANSMLFFYDVRDRKHPRRVGFFSGLPFEITATSRHLVIWEGNLATVIDRPFPGPANRPD